MKRQTYPSDLTDEQWEYIKELIPAAKHGGRKRTVDMQEVMNGIMYVVKGAIQWRMLPNDFPKWKTVYHYYNTWRKAGVWKRIHDTLRAKVREKEGKHKHPTAGSIDSQSVKASEWSGERGFDSAKSINGKKRHLIVDTLGLVMALLVTKASVQDRDGARRLFKNLKGACKKLRLLWVDGAYRGKLLDWVNEYCKFRLEPVLRSDDQKGFVVLPRRWVVERTFAWLSQYRRLNKDYERLDSSSESMIYIAMIRLMLRRLA